MSIEDLLTVSNPTFPEVEASRFDSDSEGFEEEQNFEFSPLTQEIRQKNGIKDQNEPKPWALHLAKLYQTRKDSLKKKEVEKRLSEEEEKIKKKQERERLIQVLDTTLEKHEDELLDLENHCSSPNGLDDQDCIDNSSVVDRYLDPSDDEIDDEEDDDDRFDEQEMEDLAWRKLRYQMEGIVEHDEVGGEHEEDAEDEELELGYDPRSVRERLLQNGSYKYEERFFPRAPPNTRTEDPQEPDVRISKEVVVNGYVYKNRIVIAAEEEYDEDEYGDDVYIEGRVKLRDIYGDSEEICGIPRCPSQYYSGEEDYEDEEVYDEENEEEEYDEEEEEDYEDEEIGEEEPEYDDEQVGDEEYDDEEVYDEDEEVYDDEEQHENEKMEDEELCNGVHRVLNDSKTARDLEEDFKVLRRLTFDDSSEPDHTEPPPPETRNVEKSCTKQLQKSEMTVKDRVLAVLSMVSFLKLSQ